ncbi:DUF421 domain-containing protein [Clostridium thermarum]|uniref:DUF421 domain-containing protein n=1 Tax=Clostridium thermarum TaxID=1716543 RepID=UPI0011203D3E|nr:DUF421 domain-containing protein [Clostridium thermarum]
MFILLFRTIILFVAVIFSMRIMGKRQIGQLQPYELVVAIMVSELASLPMQDTRIPLLHGVIPIATLLIIQIIISILELKFDKARSIIDGKPSIVICKGKLVISELRNQVFTVNDLMEELRIKGYFSIEDIEYAILETNGQLSVIPKTSSEPVTKGDMNVSLKEKNLPLTVISEGKIIHQNLRILKKDEQWLKAQLKNNHIKTEKDVFIAIMNSEDELYIQDYSEDTNKSKEIEI